MKHKISILVLMIVLNSCIKLKNKNGENPQPQTNESITDLNYRYDLAGESDQVVFDFPTSWGDRFFVEKTIDGSRIYQNEIMNLSGQWKDQIDETKKINYKFYQNTSRKEILLGEVEVLPILNLNLNQDLNLAQVFSLNEKTKKIYIRRLELQKETHLFIEDFKGELTIEKLISDEGFLQTFANAQRAPLEKNGRSAGDFKLNVQSGEGLLHLSVIAESGGDGQPGAPPDESMVGAVGETGAFALFNFEYMANRYSCVQPPGKGFIGHQGQRGHAGTDAGNGGSIQDVQVKNNSAQLEIKNFYQIGQKGIGGLGASGGRGGPGGPGGDGGVRDLYRFKGKDYNDPRFQLFYLVAENGACAPAPPGETGSQGEPGANGHDGLDGTWIKN